MKTLIFFATVAVVCSKALGATTVFLPSEAILQDGNSSLAAPFLTSTSSRLQQVYAHDAFPNAGFGTTFLIQGVYFRVNESAPPFNETFPRVQVDLSTTSRGPAGLSTLFSDNSGADETTVFGPGPLQLIGSRFNLSTGFLFARPFFYDPAAGNLLLDIRNFGPGNASLLDAFDVVGDSVSIAIGRAEESTAFAVSTRALATAFFVDIVPIPEPTTTALLLLGALALGWRLWRSRNSTSTPG